MLNRAQETYRLELRRAVANGILEAAGGTFLLLIAVKWFRSGATAKALVAAGGSMGLMLTPMLVSAVTALGWPTAVAASRLAAVGSVVFLIMAAAPWEPVYVVGSLLSMAAASVAIPLMTQIYQENYPEKERGTLFSRAVMVRIGSAALFSAAAGRVLATNMANFRWLLLIFAGAFGFASYCLSKYPSRALSKEGGSHPFRAMRFVRDDRLFRHTLICWMFMGFANLMMLPMRVEYLANPRYGLALDAGIIALVTGVVPNMARLVMSPIWGYLFDRMNFFVLRVTLNIGFAAGILTFFLSDDFPGFIVGALIFGVSNAGGDVAWGLWVTKFAPPDRVAEYMSVHTFFTGVRGVIAPLVAFHLVGGVRLPVLGWISAGLIAVASLMLLPEIKSIGRSRAPAMVEEISE